MEPVLIICQHFIPYAPSLGRVIRMVTLASFLKKQGFKVVILTSKGVDFGCFGYEKLLNDLSIIYLNDPLKVRVQKKQALKFSGRNVNSRPKHKIFFDNIIKFLAENIAIPDLGFFMVNKYTKKAYEIIVREQIKNVIISTPPHSLQLVGVKLKQRLREKISLISEYRDSWNVSPAFSKNFFLAKFISEKMEKKNLSLCDKFIFVSPPMLSKLQKQYNIDISSKSHLIMNGFIEEYDVANSTNNIRNEQQIRIGYFGQASDRQNDTHSIHNLLTVLQKKKFKNLIFEFYGAIELSSAIRKNSLQVHIHERIPHDIALQKMAEMDFLLFLYSDPRSSDEVISGKLFDYISVRRPILCLGPQNMEARRIVEKFGIGLTIDIENPNDIEEKLASLPSILGENLYKNLDISQFKRENQYQKFLELLE